LIGQPSGAALKPHSRPESENRFATRSACFAGISSLFARISGSPN
jgi:hypothetical protein